MRVAVVCPYGLDRHGGVQRQAAELVERLNALGHRARLVGPGRQGPPGSVLVGGGVGVPFNRSVAPVGLGWGVVGATRRAVADAEVVHLHEPLVPLVSMAVLTGYGGPIVGTFHAAPGASVRAAYRLAGPWARRLAARLTVSTAVSSVAAIPASGLGLEPVIVPNGVDTAALRPSVERVPLRVAFVGRDEPRKGLDVLLTAWPGVRERLPGAELVVMGASRAGLSSGVHFLGRVSEEEKRRQLAAAPILVAPNLGGESFGLVVVEGMAAGCAVVASAIPGFAEVAGQAGLLVPPGDPDALRKALIRVLTDEEMTQELSARGRRRAEEFDWQAVVPRYLDAYREAIES